MERNSLRPVTAPAMVLLLALAACVGAEKSSNPLSPSIAGPIAGVEITPPRAVEPAQGSKYRESQQPIRLLVENASTNGVRPLYYTFEVAADSEFQTKMFARAQVPPGADGRTSVQVDRLELGRTYYWRARAEDGANTGPFVAVQFEVLPRPSLGAPPLISPINNVRTPSRRPTLVVGAADRNAAVGAVVYEFQIALDGAFAQIVAAAEIGESGGETSFTPGGDLPADRQHFWRARAKDPETVGPWAGTQGFVTPGAGGSGPGPGPAPGGPCISSSPEAIVSCERSKFGHMSHGEMFEFVRAVARSLNANGIPGGPYGILRKGSGTNCNGYSCDVICAGQGSGQRQWDVLGDIDGAQSPGWSGPHTVPGIRVDVCEIQ
jgi:hypothetical protein